MKLDKRIKEGKRPLTCFDTEQAMQFIGKQCYFSDSALDFMDLDKADGDSMFYVAELQNVWTAEEYCFADQSNDWRYILPVEFVKEEEKKEQKEQKEQKYRPYSLNEFLERYKIGETVTFRLKKDGHAPEAECLVECTRMITGYETLPEDRDKPGESSILLGGCPPISLSRLFEFYELENKYYFPKVWQPFGVLDKENE